MNVQQLLHCKYKGKSSSFHRHLTDDPAEGILASGFIKKKPGNPDRIDLVTDSYHGILILSGTAIYKDSKHNIKLRAGDFFQRFPGRAHTSIITSENYSEIYIVMGKGLYEQLAKINVLDSRHPVLHPGIDFESIQNLIHIQDQLSFTDRSELPLLVPQFIQYLTRITYLSRNDQWTTSEKETLAIAVQFIQDHLTERITGEDVASYVNLGYEKFRKLFARQYHISPGNYIIHKRINYSQQLLSDGNHTIKEVAFELGYLDAASFSKQFKKITGRSPSDFQRLFLE